MLYDEGKQPAMADVMAGLRKQYGPELPKVDSDMRWAFDEQGKALPASTPKLSPGCAGNIAETGGGGGTIPFLIPFFTGSAADVAKFMTRDCRYHVHVSAGLTPAPHNPALMRNMDLKASENAEDARDVLAGQMYLNEQAKKK